MLSEEVLASIESCVLCWLATASADGRPSVSPKEVFTHFEGSIIIANIASPGSASNIRENGRACVSFVDVFRQKGWQVKGAAAVLRGGDAGYDAMAARLEAMTEGLFPFKSVFRVTPEEVRPIVAPRYRLYPETTESEQVARAMAAYGVRPADDA